MLIPFACDRGGLRGGGRGSRNPPESSKVSGNPLLSCIQNTNKWKQVCVNRSQVYVFRMTYKTIVRPVMEYASTAWDPHKVEDKERLETVQRRATRYVHNNFYDQTPGCATGMMTDLRWDTFETCRHINRLTMLYKINNNIVGINKIQFFKGSDSRTRGAERIKQIGGNHTALYNSFFPRTIRSWNKLPTQLTETPSLEAFHCGLGSYTAASCGQLLLPADQWQPMTLVHSFNEIVFIHFNPLATAPRWWKWKLSVTFFVFLAYTTRKSIPWFAEECSYQKK